MLCWLRSNKKKIRGFISLQENKSDAAPKGLYHCRKGRGVLEQRLYYHSIPTGGAGMQSIPRIQGSYFGNVLPCTNHLGAFFVKEAADLCRVFSFYNFKTGLKSLFF
jgi:hypothetical protein